MNQANQAVENSPKTKSNLFNRFFNAKLNLKILIYLSPVILFWALVLVTSTTNAIRSENEFSFLNDILLALIASLAFLPIVLAIIFYTIAERVKKIKIAVMCLPILCFHAVSTIAVCFPSLISYLFAETLFGLWFLTDTWLLIVYIVVWLFWLFCTFIVVLLFIDVIKELKKK